MPRLIDANEVQEYFEEFTEYYTPPHNEYEAGKADAYTAAADYISDCKTVDAELVKHGHWFLLDECSNAGMYCSCCHKKVYREQYANQKIKSPYCPNCGARMDEVKE